MTALRRISSAILALTLLFGTAEAFDTTGRFLYEDKLWDQFGYTGATQDLPIRQARVEIVNATTQEILGTGTTDADGFFAVEITGQVAPLNLMARCLTDGRDAGYEIRVVDELVRGLGEPAFIGNIHAIATDPILAHDPANDLDFGTYITQDTDGTGVAQAFNIFDNVVDFFDWMAQPIQLGQLPNASEYVVLAWSGTSANEGSNYSGHAILISSPGQGNDTDGWADTVILHETGHWFDDFYSNSDNPGGSHFIGDNHQNPLLSYGEGVATFHCAKVRDFRALRLNLSSQPIDDHISIYADLQIPPDSMMAGSLSFSYDFETGFLWTPTTSQPIGQRGTANETNVTSALWDLVDGPNTRDETPLVDDDAVEVTHDVTWDIEVNYLVGQGDSNPMTVEDYYQGWFVQNGPSFMKTDVDFIFIDLNLMEFYADSFEPDNNLANASSISPLPHSVSASGQIVINEVDPGTQDAVELYNASDQAQDLTGWQLQVYVNGDTQPVANRIYVFPSFVLQPGEVVAVFERGDVLNNGQYHLYAGDTPASFNMSWAHGGDGACELRNDGGTPVDFVRWRDSGGVDNSTPTPAGLTYTGLLDSPVSPPFNLARDIDGTDTDDASDFSSVNGTLAAVNHPNPEHHTSFDVNDADVFSIQAQAGTRYGFEARGSFSASDPRIEILNSSGAVLGSNDNVDPGVLDARVDFYASETATVYVRVTHSGPFTDWAAYDFMAFERPVSTVFLPPSSIGATAYNQTDTGDNVEVKWLNSGGYDAVRLYRDGVLLVELPGAPTEYLDNADRGLHEYAVSGVINEQETATISTFEFAGVVTCHAEDDFESGTGDLWITEGTNWGVTPFASEGLWGFTDSPAGTYQGCPTGSGGCTNSASAVFGVPTLLPENSTLNWDQICITEHCSPTPCDVCIVEVSTDNGVSWVEVARYDQASDPAWEDNVADPTDWRPASVDLSPFAFQYVLVRYRLQADQLLELDGWYIDDVRINDELCTPVPTDTEDSIARLYFKKAFPNPMSSGVNLAFSIPGELPDVDISIYNVAGRLVRQHKLGTTRPGAHLWHWDGKNDRGADVASGIYFAKLRAGSFSSTQKLVKIVGESR